MWFKTLVFRVTFVSFKLEFAANKQKDATDVKESTTYFLLAAIHGAK